MEFFKFSLHNKRKKISHFPLQKKKNSVLPTAKEEKNFEMVIREK